MYSFTGALKTHVSLCQIFSDQTKVVNENAESTSRPLCNIRTLKPSPTACCCLNQESIELQRNNYDV